MDPWVRDRPAGVPPGRSSRTTQPRRREVSAAGIRRWESGPGQARALAHEHPAVQECERFCLAKTRIVQESRTSLIDGRVPTTRGNALASVVTAARMHATTPANSGVISLAAASLSPGYVTVTSSYSWRPGCWTRRGFRLNYRRSGQIRPGRTPSFGWRNSPTH